MPIHGQLSSRRMLNQGILIMPSSCLMMFLVEMLLCGMLLSQAASIVGTERLLLICFVGCIGWVLGMIVIVLRVF